MPDPYRHGRGRPLPLGTSRAFDGTNFAVLSRHATAVTLLIQPEGAGPPLAEIALDGRHNRTGDHWHVRLHDLPETCHRYGWRVDGPVRRASTGSTRPASSSTRPSTMISGAARSWADTCETDPERTSRRSLYHRAKPPPTTGSDDRAAADAATKTRVIYEVHVRGFTRATRPAMTVAAPGTFAGLIGEDRRTSSELGVTAIELLPIHEFDECDCPFVNPKTPARSWSNFWGYNSHRVRRPEGGLRGLRPDTHGQIRPSSATW